MWTLETLAKHRLSSVQGGNSEHGGYAERHAIESIDRCLAAAGTSLDKVAKVNLYLADFGMIGAANEIYAQYFKHRPAKTGVGVDKLWGGALIEIEVVASR